MLRRLFTLLSAVSVALCAATCVLWVRSYRVADQWRGQTDDTGVSVRSDQGAIVYRWRDGLPPDGNDPWRWEALEPEGVPSSPGRGAGRLGFGSDRDEELVAPAGAVPEGATFSPRAVRVARW